MSVSASLRSSPLIRTAAGMYVRRFTTRGRFLFVLSLLLGFIGMDTRRTFTFELFAIAFALLAAASLWVFVRRGELSAEVRLPTRLTARRALTLPVRVHNHGRRVERNAVVTWPLRLSADAPVVTPDERYATVLPGSPTTVTFEVMPPKRGRFRVRGPAARVVDPVGLVMSKPHRTAEETVVVYPRYFTVSELQIPLGRRYQPGGIPLTSSTGDAIEFSGTRDYRRGDPVRSIHWRSFARRGEPVVKEHQEEYFCRIALILDTFLPPRPSEEELEAFEAGISVLASISDYFSRSEFVVDILAAGPDVYEVSAGRSLAYLDNILDVLASLGPCPDPPFARIGPHLFDRLAQLTTVVAVLQDWDERRADFLRRVTALGTSVRGFVLREGETTDPVPDGPTAFGEIGVMRPSEVESALESGGAVALRSSAPAAGVVHV